MAAERDAEDLPRFGDVLEDRYQVGATIGRGGMGTVFSAVEIETGRKVAIKTLNPDDANRFEMRTRLLREARAAGEVASERVVRVYHVGHLELGTPYLVLELLKGKTFDSVARARERAPIERCVDLVVEVCEGLAAAHAAGIIHRDLKPSNLFIAEREGGGTIVKILDFGISKAPALESPEAELPTITITGATLGSPQYMSPEQIRNARSVDLRTDIFSLGVVLYKMVTGKLPFEAETLAAYASAVAADAPAPLTALRSDAPVALERVVLRCLEKEPAKRYPSAAALAQALAPFASIEGRALAERIALDYGDAPTTRHDDLTQGDATMRDAFSPVVDADPTTIAAVTQTMGKRTRWWRSSLAFAAAMGAGAAAAVVVFIVRDASPNASSPPRFEVSAADAATTPSSSASERTALATIAPPETATPAPASQRAPKHVLAVAPPSQTPTSASAIPPRDPPPAASTPKLKPLMEDQL